MQADSPQPIHRAFLTYKVSEPGRNDEYVARRPMDLTSCHNFGTEIMRLTSGEENICFLGTFNGFETDETGNNLTNWVFEK